ncbi:MAG: hypothetical protein HY816_11555 [Candidatus Wallbacteria bacterium]|nr:hypothetical protein [Candidatus Wallbacteria bacterium]
MRDFGRILRALAAESVEYVLIGGLAMVAQGSAHVTMDVDVCYDRKPENLERVCLALATLHPRLRGAPEGLPFCLDARTLGAGLNFTLSTDAGDLDLLGEVAGVGAYQDFLHDAIEADLYGTIVLIASIDSLILCKQAADRPKDRNHILELLELRKLARS